MTKPVPPMTQKLRRAQGEPLATQAMPLSEKKVPAGTILAVTNGMYSAYALVGLFKVLKDFDIDKEFHGDLFRDRTGFEDYAIEHTSNRLAQMEKAGLIEEITYMELQTEVSFEDEAYELTIPNKWWKESFDAPK